MWYIQWRLWKIVHIKKSLKKKKKERNCLGDVFLESSLQSYSVLHWDFYILHIYSRYLSCVAVVSYGRIINRFPTWTHGKIWNDCIFFFKQYGQSYCWFPDSVGRFLPLLFPVLTHSRTWLPSNDDSWSPLFLLYDSHVCLLS